jgi:acetyl esterase/lipase
MARQSVTYTYKRAADCEIRADVHLPPGEGPRPVIVWIHGGALILGARGGIAHWQLEMYLDAGCAVVSIDYRLAPETKLPAIIEDLQDAWRWVMREGPELFHADTRRVAVMGHSAGGYLTLMAGFCVEPRPSALVSFYGYGDIVGPWYSRPDPYYCRQPAVSQEEARRVVGQRAISESSGEQAQGRDRFYLYCRQQGIWPREVSGHDPDSEPEFFHPYCPVRNVDPHYPPTLLLHGDRDTDVPYEQSVLMADALSHAEVEHEMVTISDGDHGFDAARDRTATDALARVLSFLSARLS